MMASEPQIIMFTGLKGGSGKTTLSALLASWLHLEKRESVALISFDNDWEMKYLKKYENPDYPVFSMKPYQFIERVSGMPGFNADNIVLDYNPYGNETDKLIYQNTQKIVIPFQDTLLDYTMLALWLNNAEELEIKTQILLQPVRVSKREKYCEEIEKFKKKFSGLNIILLPYIPCFSSESYFKISQKVLYKIRPSFIQLISK